MLKKIVILICLLTAGSVYAGEEKNFFWNVSGLRWYFAWGLDLIPTGLAVTAGYTGLPLIPGLDTILQTTLDGGYESFKTYRDTDYTPHQGNNRLEFNMPSFRWELGIKQGILWNNKLEQNLMQAFLFYRGRYDLYQDGRICWGTDESEHPAILAEHSQWQSDYQGTDAYGIFGSSFLIGMDFDTLEYNEQFQTMDGIYGEVSFEISPCFNGVIGSSDYYRLNFSAKAFKTLYNAAPQRDKNLFSIYLAEYLSVDYADAPTAMPLYVMQTFGGTRLRLGLAHSVRGFESYTWDTQLKIVNNLELRFNLPAIHFKSLVPGFIIYFDAGYCSEFWGDPSGTEGALLGSAGAGIYLNLFGVEHVRVYFQFPVIGKRLDEEKWKLDINFGLHF